MKRFSADTSNLRIAVVSVISGAVWFLLMGLFDYLFEDAPTLMTYSVSRLVSTVLMMVIFAVIAIIERRRLRKALQKN